MIQTIISQHNAQVFILFYFASPDSPGVDSPYNVQINTNVRRDVLRGISIHSIHKGEVLFSLVCTFRII